MNHLPLSSQGIPRPSVRPQDFSRPVVQAPFLPPERSSQDQVTFSHANALRFAGDDKAIDPPALAASQPIVTPSATPAVSTIQPSPEVSPPPLQRVKVKVPISERISQAFVSFLDGILRAPDVVENHISQLYMNRAMKKLDPVVEKIKVLGKTYTTLTDEQLKGKTQEFRDRLAKQLGKPLDQLDPYKDARQMQKALSEILPEVYAVAREAASRSANTPPYDVQVKAGIALHEGAMLEMKTGEGKTLTAVLPVYLNALMGKGVHVVTANEYLAKRDAKEMGVIYNALGLSVGVTLTGQTKEVKREAYHADVTYGTHSEFGFDYLRDHINVTNPSQKVQRGFFFSIVDEADSLLIDEARTPLIISGGQRMDERNATLIELFQKTAQVAEQLEVDRDYELDLERKTPKLTDEGVYRAEELLGMSLGEPDGNPLFALLQSLRAKEFYQEDVAYHIQDDKIIIVDEFTGRLSHGRRWSDGLHLAVEAKEALKGRSVKIEGETDTEASITYQNYFRLYPKLSGMTGTALTEAKEFRDVYGLPSVVVPTHRPYIQKRLPDIFYPTHAEKFNGVTEEIARVHDSGQPILVGTGSIEDSEELSQLLTAKGIKHEVLNAKNHAREALIVAMAGRLGAVTIATNMAGRGTDIKLGGDPNALAQFLDVRENALKEKAEELATVEADLAERREVLADPVAFKKMIVDRMMLQLDGLKVTTEEGKSLRERYVKLTQSRAEQMYTDETGILQRMSEDFENRKSLLESEKSAIAKERENLEAQKSKMGEEKEQVKNLGGLYVIGTERFEARRVDNQLAGRCARQGDPGQVRFFLSVDDDLFRIFEPGYRNLLKYALDPDNPNNKILSTRMTRVQKEVESRNFEARKHLLKYDDVLDGYRREVYTARDTLLQSDKIEDFKAYLGKRLDAAMEKAVDAMMPFIDRLLTLQASKEMDKTIALLQSGELIPEAQLFDAQAIKHLFLVQQFIGLPFTEILEEFGKLKGIFKADAKPGAPKSAKKTPHINQKDLAQAFSQKVLAQIMAIVEAQGEKSAIHTLRQTLLDSMDRHWKGFLNALVEMRETIQWESMAQKDPLISYKTEAPRMYDRMKLQETWDALAQLLPLSRRLVAEKRVAPLAELNSRLNELYLKKPDIRSALSEIHHFGEIPLLVAHPNMMFLYKAYLEIADGLKDDAEYAVLSQQIKDLIQPVVDTVEKALRAKQPAQPQNQTQDPAPESLKAETPLPLTQQQETEPQQAQQATPPVQPEAPGKPIP